MNAYTTAQFGQPVMPPHYERTGIIADIFGLDAPSVHLEAALGKAWAALAFKEGHRQGVPVNVEKEERQIRHRPRPRAQRCIDLVLACIEENPGVGNNVIADMVGCARCTAMEMTRVLSAKGIIKGTKPAPNRPTAWRIVE